MLKMSSAANHRKRSCRSYSKHMSAVGSMSRTRYIKQFNKTAAKNGFSFKRLFSKIIPKFTKKPAETQQHD